MKLKTKKTAVKRFKVTKGGEILRCHAQTSHLRSKQSANTKRRKDHNALVSPADKRRMARLI